MLFYKLSVCMNKSGWDTWITRETFPAILFEANYTISWKIFIVFALKIFLLPRRQERKDSGRLSIDTLKGKMG
jgi:hypothetical protein